MPGVSQVIFAAMNLSPEEARGKKVLDVGSCDFNGSVRPLVESWSPAEYVGVDIVAGPSVDIVCSADRLAAQFGADSFDLVLCIEMLEHSRDWRTSISNLKRVCRAGGVILVTTRSFGYPCHGFPNDFWRFELEDMREVFSDCEILSLQNDYAEPGVFLKVRKPAHFSERNLSEYRLYSILMNERIIDHGTGYTENSYYRRLAMKQRIRNFSGTVFLKLGKVVTKLLRL